MPNEYSVTSLLNKFVDNVYAGKVMPGGKYVAMSHHFSKREEANDTLAKKIANVLASGKCPENFTMDLGYTDISEQGIHFIARALKSGRCPKNLTLKLCALNIGNGLSYLADALKSGYCPEDLKLEFEFTELGTPSIKALCQALKSSGCPKNLTLDLTQTYLCNADFQLLAKALKSGECPAGLRLILKFNSVSEGYTAIAKALESGKCPEGLYLDLFSHLLSDEAIKIIAEALKSGKCPKNLGLRIYTNDKNAQILDVLGPALDSGQCPEGLNLTLYGTKSSSFIAIANALNGGRCPVGLTLNLRGLCINEEGMRIFKEALSNGKCPIGLVFIAQDIDSASIAEALLSGHCPPGFHVNLLGSRVKDHEALLYAEALKSGKCPPGLNLGLGYCSISDVGLKAMADALTSGQCPEDLTLDLSANAYIKNKYQTEGYESLKNALAHPNCPARLSLEIQSGWNSQTNMRKWIDHLKNHGCPSSLKINMRGCYLPKWDSDCILDLLKSNTNILQFEFSAEDDAAKKLSALYCKRNQLIQGYPELALLIKAISHRYGLYTPAKLQAQPFSLLMTAGIFAANHNLPKDNLPQELRAYVADIQSLTTQMGIESRTLPANLHAIEPEPPRPGVW